MGVEFETLRGRGTAATLSWLELQAGRESLRFRLWAMMLLVVAVTVAGWLLPWIPIGMTPDDYSAGATAGLALIAVLGAGSTAFALRWSPVLQREPISEFILALMGQSLLVRGRQRFIKRLDVQCRRAARNRTASFALLVMDITGVQRDNPADDERFNAWLAMARGVVRSEDIVGDSGDREVWLLLLQGDLQACRRVAERLLDTGHAIDGSGLPEVRIGHAVYADDARDPDAFFRVARTRHDQRSLDNQAA